MRETPVSAFAKLRRGPVRVSARVRARGRRDVGALHLHGHRAARRVAAEGRRGRGLDARARLARRAHAGRSARRSRSARRDSTSRWTFRSSARSGAARSASSPTTSRGTSSACRMRRRARSSAPDALFVFTHALVIIDNLRSQARVVVGVPVRAGASDAELQRAHGDAMRDIDATIARLRAPGSLAPLDLDRSRAARDGHLRILAREVRAGCRAHSRVHLRRRLLSRCCSRGASRCRSTSIRPSSIARCGRSIRRRTCITSCSTASSSSAAHRSCSCASRAAA